MLKTGKIRVWKPRKGLMPCGFHRMASKPVCSLGAGDEARTRYLDLGKVALYQMSYARKRKVDYSV